MEFVDESKLKNVNYENYPYPHTIIDNFLKTDVLNKVLSNINNLKDEDSNETCDFCIKYSFTHNLSDYLKRLFAAATAPVATLLTTFAAPFATSETPAAALFATFENAFTAIFTAPEDCVENIFTLM